MSWDYHQIDKAITEEFYRASVWLCPLCGATRDLDDWRDFTSQRPPIKPCRFCGARLIHGLTSNDGSRRVGAWYPRIDEVDDEWDS